MSLSLGSKSPPFALLIVAALCVACGDKTPAPAHSTSETPKPAAVPLVQKTLIADWCPEHGVPESVCTRCNDELVAGFQAKGDWCKAHSLPETQCVTCHPELKAKFEALAPTPAGESKRGG